MIRHLKIAGNIRLYEYENEFDDKVRAGDNVFVRVVNVTKSNVSYPQTATERNRDQMKQEFERLKQELKDKHLL